MADNSTALSGNHRVDDPDNNHPQVSEAGAENETASRSDVTSSQAVDTADSQPRPQLESMPPTESSSEEPAIVAAAEHNLAPKRPASNPSTDREPQANGLKPEGASKEASEETPSPAEEDPTSSPATNNPTNPKAEGSVKPSTGNPLTPEDDDKVETVELDEKSEELLDAIIRKEATEDGVNKLIGEGANLLTTRYGDTALHIAAQYGNYEVTNALLEHDAPMESKNYDGETALHLAARSDNFGATKALLEHHAPVESKNGIGDTALHLAARSDNFGATKALLEHHAPVESKNGIGETALHLAAQYGDFEVTKALLEHHAPVESKNRIGDTALHLAAQYGNFEVTKALLEHHAPVESKNIFRETALHVAARYRNLEAMDAFAVSLKGVDIKDKLEMQDTDGWTVLISAVSGGSEKIVRWILNRGADVTAVAKNGETALHFAARSGNFEITKALLEHQALVESGNRTGETALHLAARESNLQIMDALIVSLRGVDIKDKLELQDDNGWTVLISAVSGGSEKIVRWVLNEGADVTAVAKNGETALHFAARESNLEIMDALLVSLRGLDIKDTLEIQDDNGWTVLMSAVYGGSEKIVRWVIDQGAVMTTVSQDGETALRLAVRDERNTVIQILSELMDENSSKPMLAQLASKEELDTLKELLDKFEWNGIDSDAKKELELVWHAARKSKHRTVQKRLAGRGVADGWKKESKDWKAIHFAAYHGEYRIAWWLLDSGRSKNMDTYRKEALDVAKKRKDEFSQKDKLARPDEEATQSAKIERPMKVTKWNFDKQGDDRKEMKDSGRSEKTQSPKEKKVTEKGKEREGIESKYEFTVDILTDPPLVQGWSDQRESYGTPHTDGESAEVSKMFNATIIDFYGKKEGTKQRVDYLRRTRPVWDVIYKSNSSRSDPKSTQSDPKSSHLVEPGGPAEIMEEARGLLEKIGSSSGGYTSYKEKNLKFRWIHLPANNMIWMENLARRVFFDKEKKKDYGSLDGFMRHSWHELPGSTHELNHMAATCKKEFRLSEKAFEIHEPKKASQENLEQPAKASARDQVKSDSPVKMDVQSNGIPDHWRVALYMPYITFAMLEGNEPEAINRDKRLREIFGYDSYAKDKDNDKHAQENDGNNKDKNGIYNNKDGKDEDGKDEDGNIKDGNDEDSNDEDGNDEDGSDKSENEWKILHGSRTLDQFYYSSLKETDRRNHDQVVTRYGKSLKEGDGDKQENNNREILKVDQLWLWVIDEDTIITSSTNRIDKRPDPVIEDIFDYLIETKGRRKGRPPPSSAYEMSRFITNFCIEFINRSNDSLSACKIFANSINNDADADAILFHNFKTKIESKLNSPTEGKCDKRQKQSEQENAVQHGSDSGIGVWLKAIRYIFKKGDSDQGKVDKMADGAESNDKGVSTDQTKAYQSISDATALLVEVKDARDELNILKQLLAQQETVWNKLLNTSDQEKGLAQDKKSASRGDEKPASQRETDGLKGPGLAINDVEEMDKAAGRIQDSVNSLLSLEQNEANITEAELAGKQANESVKLADLSVKQGNIFMIFTVITIIFLPMSFLTSLFALNVTSFPHQQNNLIYDPKFIFPIIFGVTTAISILTVGCVLIKVKYKGFSRGISALVNVGGILDALKHPRHFLDASKNPRNSLAASKKLRESSTASTVQPPNDSDAQHLGVNASGGEPMVVATRDQDSSSDPLMEPARAEGNTFVSALEREADESDAYKRDAQGSGNLTGFLSYFRTPRGPRDPV